MDLRSAKIRVNPCLSISSVVDCNDYSPAYLSSANKDSLETS